MITVVKVVDGRKDEELCGGKVHSKYCSSGANVMNANH